ncbi:MAG TPA: ROK family protein [Verrucomicrobiales bacterium]|nr:ROK family protein [Verrucomicrobiales bacterium]HIL72468.1 ROK family protein [Verrucomicrobiota bacterium]
MSNSFSSEYWIGFDLGGTKMMAQVYDSEFQRVSFKRKKTKGYLGNEVGIQRIIDTIRQSIADSGVPRDRVSGIGIGCPSPIDMFKGTILNAPNLGWKNMEIGKAIEAEFNCPVAVLNDVDAGVYAEYRFGSAKNSRCALGIFPGTGIGGGCVYDDQILTGKRISCMEIGHMVVNPKGRLCGCGLRGCLETEASRLAIAAEAAKAAYRGEAPRLFELAGTNLIDIRSRVLAESVAAGDVIIEKIIRRAAGYIGLAVANCVHLLSPDIIFFFGGLVKAMPELFTETVNQVAAKNVMDVLSGSFKTVVAELGDDAGALGAAAWAKQHVDVVLNS